MIFCIEPNAFAGCCSVHFICYSRRNLFASLFIFFNWKVMVHRALHSNAISRLKVWMWDITTVNLKSHPEIKINGLYFNWKLQLLWASEKSKWLYRLLNFLLNSCCLNWKVYQFSFSFQNIMFQFSSPFILQVRFHSLRQIHEKIIVPQIARKDVFAFRPFTLHWQNSKSSFFGTWSTNSAHCKCKYAKKSQKNWIILHGLFLIF